MKIALATHAACAEVIPKEPSWEILCKKFSKVVVGEKDGLAWIPADIPSGPRLSANVISISALVLDVEQKKGSIPPSVDDLQKKLAALAFAAHVHTSYSHTPDKPRYRVILKLSAPLPPAHLKQALTTAAATLGLEDCWDTNCTDAARLFYVPRCPPGHEQYFRFFTVDGRDIAEEDLTPPPPAARTPLAPTAAILPFPQKPETPENVAYIRSQLFSINAACDRALWRSLVWSVLSTRWTCAVQLALEWSLTAPEKFEQEEFNGLIKSYAPRGISLGTLHYHAGIKGVRVT